MSEKGCGATVGTFDGMHLGHEKVVTALKEESRKRGLSPIVFTLDRHPLETIAPERAPGLITPPEVRENWLEEKVGRVVVLPFNEETAALTAREWMRSIRDKWNVTLLILGYDNTFGCDGRYLEHSEFAKIGAELGVEVIEAPVEPGISSSAIRKLLKAGDVEKVARMLGRSYEYSGIVEQGAMLGRKIGFPTVNLSIDFRACLPANGVYSAQALIREADEEKEYPAVVNIGVKPTVTDAGRQTVEANLIGYQGNLYGKKVTLKFLSRLRDEKKFENIDELKKQINKDIEAALENYAMNGSHIQEKISI